MSDSSLYAVQIAALVVAALSGLLASLGNLRTIHKDGRSRLTGVAWAVCTLALTAVVFTAIFERGKQRNEAREKAVTDAKAQARNEAVTRRLESVLAGTQALQDESKEIHTLSSQALHQIDTALALSRALAHQQERAIGDLGLSIQISRRMADSLHASVTISRRIVDSLRLAEARADIRTRQTLSDVARAGDPLSSASAPVTVTLNRGEWVSGQIIDALFARYVRNNGSFSVPDAEFWVHTAADSQHVLLPAEVVLSFSQTADCGNLDGSEQILVQAERRLDYDQAEPFFAIDSTTQTVRSVRLEWPSGPFELRTGGQVAVDDVRGACVSVHFRHPWLMMGVGFAEPLWKNLDVHVSPIMLPRGRRAYLVERMPSQGSIHFWRVYPEF